MHKLLLSTFILISLISHAQDYIFEYDVDFQFDNCSGNRRRFYNYMYYTTTRNGTPREITAFQFYRQEGFRNIKGFIRIPASDGPINKIWVNTERQALEGLGTYWNTKCKEVGTVMYQSSGTEHCFNLNGATLNWGCLNTCVGITNRVFRLYAPLSNISTPNNPGFLLPTNEKIVLKTTPGFQGSVYIWEKFKKYLDLGWIKIPIFEPLPTAFQNTSQIAISATDLFGASAEDSIGKNVRIRVNAGCGSVTNDIILSVRLSSPHITSLTPYQPKCFGDNTGGIKIKFDRQLKFSKFKFELLNIFIRDAKDTSKTVASMYNLTYLDADSSITFPSTLPPGKYEIKLIGKYPDTTLVTYTDGPKHKDSFQIIAPPKLTFATTKQNDVRCYGGNDGAIKVTATGGVGNYKAGYKKLTATDFTWQNFSTATAHTITGLDIGTYAIKVRDANDCFEKNIMNKEAIDTIIVNQPTEPVKIDFSEVTDPLGYGRTDGNIKVIVKGGTKKGDGSYNITWKKEDGTLLSTVANTNLGTTYQTVLQNIGKGKYIVNITDSNFSIAASGATEGCMLIDTFNVNEPPPIIIKIDQQKNILCKDDAGGELAAHVTGGVPYTTGATVPYKYQWFRKEATDIDLTKTDSIASDLKAGNYIVKVTDKNGIEKLSDIFTINEPDSLKINFTTTINACTSTGNITANITGGSAPYHIDWPTADTTITISNIVAGNYVAVVKDAHGCQTQSTIKLVIPNAITIDNAITKNPTYYNSKDGAIQLTVSGGNPPYTYLWNNGATTKDIQGLTAGVYAVTITDSRGCTKLESYTLQNPPRIIQTGGSPLPNGITTKTLCNGQRLDIDATIADNAATYQWNSTNGFSATTAKVSLTNAGKYWITVTDSRGITASDTLIIKQNNASINASFVISTQAFRGEKLTFFNISYPAADHIEWLIPNDPKIEITQNYQNVAEVIFKDTGTYAISMKAFVGECEQVITKKVIVVEASKLDDIGQTQNPFVKEFTIMPNPNSGQFNVKIVLQEQAKIRLRMMNITSSAVINDQQFSRSNQYLIPYTITAASGIYILLLETPKGSDTRKVIIN